MITSQDALPNQIVSLVLMNLAVECVILYAFLETLHVNFLFLIASKYPQQIS